ncbi:hypothetical protein [Kineococcus terrestris]|uniref:hypothetical protein n=1 Tax=Kineococcus terrestris TaxID=2044856 RepID=UPI0034DB3B8B
MKLSVLYVADQSAPAVAASLAAVVEAAGLAEEARGLDVDATLVTSSDDPEVLGLLQSVDGAEVQVRGTAAPPVHLWRELVASSSADVVYLATALSAPAPETFTRLLDALEQHPGAVAAAPGHGNPRALLVRRERFVRIGGFASPRVTGMTTGPEALAELVWSLQSLGEEVVHVPGARVGGVPLRQPARTPDRVLRDRRFEVASRDAVSLGPHTYLGDGARCVTYATTQRIRIGAYTSIADGVRLLHQHPRGGEVVGGGGSRTLELLGLHVLSRPTTYPLSRLGGMPLERPGPDDLGAPMVIGNDVWIGDGATILGAVTVGDGAVVGAGAVVARDVRPYAVVVGNPAREVRSRFSPEVVDALLRIAWWDWPEDVLLERVEWFRRPVEEFVARFG